MIIDTHQHFYEPGTPRAKGPEDYKMLAAPEAVTGTILLADQEFALNLAAEERLVVGVGVCPNCASSSVISPIARLTGSP